MSAGAECATFVVYIAYEEGLERIAVIAVKVDGDVVVDKISSFERSSGEWVGAYIRTDEGLYSSHISLLLTLSKLSSISNG